MRPGQDDIKNQLIDREIELRASSNSEKEKLKKELENTNLENKRLRHEITTLSNTSITSSNDEVVSMLRDRKLLFITYTVIVLRWFHIP